MMMMMIIMMMMTTTITRVVENFYCKRKDILISNQWNMQVRQLLQWAKKYSVSVKHASDTGYRWQISDIGCRWQTNGIIQQTLTDSNTLIRLDSEGQWNWSRFLNVSRHLKIWRFIKERGSSCWEQVTWCNWIRGFWNLGLEQEYNWKWKGCI